MLESENCDDASIFLIPSMWKDWPSTEGDASSGIPRCKVDPDTQSANEVGGGSIGPSLEGKIEASSLFTKEAIRTKDYLLTQNTFNFHSLGVAQSVWHSLLTKRVGGSILGGANYFYFQT